MKKLTLLILVFALAGCSVSAQSSGTASGGSAQATADSGMTCTPNPDGTMNCVPTSTARVSAAGGNSSTGASNGTSTILK